VEDGDLNADATRRGGVGMRRPDPLVRVTSFYKASRDQ